MAAYGVKFGEKHSITDFGLLLNERPKFIPPEPKTNYLDVPGCDGGIDATEVFGEVKYGWAKLEFKFLTIRSRKKWNELYFDLINYLHGKKMKIILDEDPDHYYIGRLKINDWESSEKYSVIAIEAKIDPFKYDTSGGSGGSGGSG